jgi:hypothetical protein
MCQQPQQSLYILYLNFKNTRRTHNTKFEAIENGILMFNGEQKNY